MDARANAFPPRTHTDRVETDRSAQDATVWDLPLRLFHWAMVSVVTIAAITGFLTPEWWLDIHVMAGYALSVLLVFRLSWGFVGSLYSRFSSFPLMPSALISHLEELSHRVAKRAVAHNPAGAWMIVVLLVTLGALIVSGLLVLGGQENLGPLAFMIGFRVGDFAAEIHEALATVLLGAIAVHLLGVFVETRILHHPVLAAMLPVRRKLTDGHSTVRGRPHTVRGTVLFICVAGALIAGGVALSSIPASGWRALKAPDFYLSECGDCHTPYHPALRTAGTWDQLMDGLEDHYGEDASLDNETTAAITAYLIHNSARTFDTEAANRIGRMQTPSMRMTDTPYWKKRHRDIKPAVFRSKGIGSKINCNSCHKDAASGRFDDVNIDIPNGEN